MSICQVMIKDFMYGWGDPDSAYGEKDILVGIQYAKDLIEFEGLEREPFHNYDLQGFIEWANKKLYELK